MSNKDLGAAVEQDANQESARKNVRSYTVLLIAGITVPALFSFIILWIGQNFFLNSLGGQIAFAFIVAVNLGAGISATRRARTHLRGQSKVPE